MKHIYRIFIFIGLSVIPITSQAQFFRTAMRIIAPKIQAIKAKLPSLHWYQAGMKTGLKIGMLAGIAAAPGLKLYPEKKSIKDRFKLAKDELQQQTILLKEHVTHMATQTKNFFSNHYSKQQGDKYLFLFARK